MNAERPALVADIGGTHVRFALACSTAGGAPELRDPLQLNVADHASLVAAGERYLATRPQGGARPRSAVLAIAGRVDGDHAVMTNHPWQIHGRDVARALGLEHVALINDFSAQALAVAHLQDDERVLLGGHHRPAPPTGQATFAVLGPGTGLGVSALLRRNGHSFALESEGGHAAFAPKTARQRAVLEQLSERYPRVSYERLLSGGGLSNLHWALARLDDETEPPTLRPEDVTAAARAGDPRSSEAIELFCSVFGALAGDLVLTFGAWDGVYLSGGLVPRLLSELQQGAFRRAFENKGRFSDALARVPVHAVVHPQAGLLGAGALALERATAQSAHVERAPVAGAVG